MSEPLLKIASLSRSFGAVRAVDDVSLEVAAGSICGIIGPNGAGKTTVVNMVSGHLRPDAGGIALGDGRLDGLRVHEIAARGVARTFQNIRLYKELSALDNVVMGCHMHRRADLLRTLLRGRSLLDRRIAAELMERVGLDPERFGRMTAGSLSYGDQRRLEIARALAQRPQLLILDEPAAGMNAAEKNALRPLLDELREDGLTIVLIEHDMRLVMSICDDLAVLDFGRRIAGGSPAEVAADPEVIRAYLGAPAQAAGPPTAAPAPALAPGLAPARGAAGPAAMLSVRDLHVSYGAVAAVRGVSFDVRRGELVALVGANGAGKTTILRTISGLQRPRSGEISFDGTNLRRLSSSRIVREGLIHVPEGREILARQTVRENLELGAYSRTDKRAIAREIAELLDWIPQIGDRADVPAGQLSGGEQQLLAIMRALLSRPRVLMLDEPSLGLAPQTAESVFRLIEHLHGGGMSILLVEQNAYRALELADRAWVIETGEVSLHGPGHELLQNPAVRHAYLGLTDGVADQALAVPPAGSPGPAENRTPGGPGAVTTEALVR